MTDIPTSPPISPPGPPSGSTGPIGSDPAAALRLRPRPPRVVRLSRRALALIGGVAGAAIGGLLIYALQSAAPKAERELYPPEGRPGAEALARAPRDYSEIPRLGPPLPGDLGRPILEAQERGAAGPTPPIGPVPAASAHPDPAEQEREAARSSPLFLPSSLARQSSEALGGGSWGGGSPTDASPDALAVLQSSAFGASGGAAPASLSPQEEFLSRSADRQTVSAERLAPPASPYILQAGAVIPAALITGIRSDLPGQITAQVTEPVYDSPTGRILLIPQGARLIGEYDSEVSFGQERVLLAWDRLIFPDGRSIVLEHEPGADAAGQAGLQDRVDHHWDKVMRAAVVSTLLGVGTELAADDEDELVRALRRGTQDTINEAGRQIIERQLAVRPTLTIRPGHPVRVLVTRDLILAPSGAAP